MLLAEPTKERFNRLVRSREVVIPGVADGIGRGTSLVPVDRDVGFRPADVIPKRFEALCLVEVHVGIIASATALVTKFSIVGVDPRVVGLRLSEPRKVVGNVASFNYR